jgi:hypothetical protein
MPARVDDELVTKAADALVEAAKSMTNAEGLLIRCPMDIGEAKSAIMAALVNALGYPNSIMPTGWAEISNFGASNGA